jgi:serine/threonine-protein kinase
MLEKYLLYGKHQALAVLNDNVYIFDTNRKKARLKVANIGEFLIEYDGFSFYMDEVSGDVFVNNIPVNTRYELSGSTVITIGLPELGMSRRYLTFDISNPEVTL